MRASALLGSVSAITVAFACLVTGISGAQAAGYAQTNLVSDIGGLAAITDPNLINPWGVSDHGGSPFWVSDQGTDVSTLYAVTGATSVSQIPLVVSIPTTVSGPQGPTGQVSNSNTASFLLNGSSSLFIFANLNGTISAWNGVGTSASVTATTTGAVYTGLAINSAQTMLFAANAVTGAVDAFDGAFAPTSLGAGAFATPSDIAAKKLIAFNVQDIGGNVFVTYAPVGRAAQAGALAGQGAVAEFSETGGLEREIVGGPLASPWGVALAPAGFGAFGGDLLVGNESAADPGISAFDPVTGMFEGSIPIDPGAGNSSGALWALTFGFGGAGGDPNVLYFADGINGEKDGLFGAIQAVPEAPTWALMLGGFGLLAAAAARRGRAIGGLA